MRRGDQSDKELREAWANLIGAIDRNENVGATITARFDLVYNFLERRYGRFVIILSQGRLREEVLANVARQLLPSDEVTVSSRKWPPAPVARLLETEGYPADESTPTTRASEDSSII